MQCTSVILDPGAGPRASMIMEMMSSFPAQAAKDRMCSPGNLGKINVSTFLTIQPISQTLLNMGIRVTAVNESSNPLPEIQTGDPGCSHVATTANQMLDQINVLIYHGDMERSET